METQEEAVDFSSIDSEDLAALLTKFYCEAKPKPLNSRPNTFTAEVVGEYHKNTLKNIRGAINRHLQDLGRNIDIVNDKEFRATNKTLKGLLKLRMEERLLRPSLQDEFISEEDMKSIIVYFQNADSHPVILRQCVWFNLAKHFSTRVGEFHQRLKINSFSFKSDEKGEYAYLSHEVKVKSILCEDSPVKKRMYATQTRQCPVKLLKLLIEKTDKNADSLFNQYNKASVEYPMLEHTWYVNKSLKKRSYANFLSDICKYANTSKIYAPYCLRTTVKMLRNSTGYTGEGVTGSKNEHCSKGEKHSPSSAQPRVVKVVTMEDWDLPLDQSAAPDRSLAPDQCPSLDQSPAPESNAGMDSCAVPTSTKTSVSSTSGKGSSSVAMETNSSSARNDD
jgi:hypothetical protein